MRVFVLGLDGATFDLIDPWIAEGELPNIGRVMEEGSHGALTSTIPAHSAPSWSSFITGKNPGKHRIFDFSEHVDGSYEVKFVNASHRHGMSVWAIASSYSKRVAVVNVPMTYPPEKVNGLMISGMDAPGLDSNFTYPFTLFDELREIVGAYSLEAGLWSYIKKGEIDLAIKKQHETIDRRFEVTKYLMNKYPWDLFVSVFTATDRVQHAFWKYMDPKHPQFKREESEKYGNAILDVYRKMDHIVGYLVENLGDDTVLFMMSDHGAGLCSNKTLYLNNWLCKNGLLEYKDFHRGKASGISERLKRLLYTRLLSGMPRDFWKALPRETRDQVRKRFPSVFNKMASQFFFSRIEMDRTQAYAEESKNFVWVNLKGREPKGMVNPGQEYEQVRERIVNGLLNERDPENDEPVVDSVYKREELYHGENFEKAPDLVVTFKDMGYVPRPSYTVAPSVVLRTIPRGDLEKLESNTRANARHLTNGILLMRGKGIRQGHKIDGAHIMDLAPTILYVMGLPVPTDMDGKALETAFDEEFLSNNPIRHKGLEVSYEPKEEIAAYSPEEEEAIRQRLGDLGYLE
ncbi:MAG: alkaline phosphatase family protein [Planctomycetota bacterium]|jgi:predicted AlkP superfamily phosphohydrolase/phosphomutase